MNTCRMCLRPRESACIFVVHTHTTLIGSVSVLDVAVGEHNDEILPRYHFQPCLFDAFYTQLQEPAANIAHLGNYTNLQNHARALFIESGRQFANVYRQRRMLTRMVKAIMS